MTIGMVGRTAPGLVGPGAADCCRLIAQALRTEAGSTFTPGPMVEETAMRWM